MKEINKEYEVHKIHGEFREEEMPQETNKEWEKKINEEFLEEWEKSNSWGFGKFGTYDETLEDSTVFVADKDEILDWWSKKINDLLSQKDEEWRDKIDSMIEKLEKNDLCLYSGDVKSIINLLLELK